MKAARDAEMRLAVGGRNTHTRAHLSSTNTEPRFHAETEHLSSRHFTSLVSSVLKFFPLLTKNSNRVFRVDLRASADTKTKAMSPC